MEKIMTDAVLASRYRTRRAGSDPLQRRYEATAAEQDDIISMIEGLLTWTGLRDWPDSGESLPDLLAEVFSYG